MSPEEERDVKAIERFIGKSILRVTVPDFDYKKHPTPQDGDKSRGSGRTAGRSGSADHGRGRAHEPRAHTSSSRPSPSAPATPVHGRRPRRDAPGSGRKSKRM
jgi:hypothetical protein